MSQGMVSSTLNGSDKRLLANSCQPFSTFYPVNNIFDPLKTKGVSLERHEILSLNYAQENIRVFF